MLLNGFLIPLIFMMTGTPWSEYWVCAGSLLLTEAVFIYTIGVGVYYSLKRLRQREIAFCSKKAGISRFFVLGSIG